MMATLIAMLPAAGNNPMMSPCGNGGGFENGWPGISRVGGGPPRSTDIDRC